MDRGRISSWALGCYSWKAQGDGWLVLYFELFFMLRQGILSHQVPRLCSTLHSSCLPSQNASLVLLCLTNVLMLPEILFLEGELMNLFHMVVMGVSSLGESSWHPIW